MLVLPSSLTHDTASACVQMLLQTLQSDPGNVVEVDASALVRFDSSALAVLLECRRASQALGKGFVVRGLDTRLAGLSVLYGVQGLLPDAPLPLGASAPA
jgi:phospholipid transport system transporter-binding protein